LLFEEIDPHYWRAIAAPRCCCDKPPMNASVTVRPARTADEKALGRLGTMLVVEHHGFDPQRFIAPIPQLPKRYGEFLVSQAVRRDKLVLVAERNGELVGYAYGGVEGNDYMVLRGPAGEIYDLVVDPAHRRQGIGTILLEATLRELKARGAPRVVLFTAEKNHGAQAMFAGAGFRRTMIEMTRELGD
jgi:ribosomal protein S18 acetylase RimI-like enzyme